MPGTGDLRFGACTQDPRQGWAPAVYDDMKRTCDDVESPETLAFRRKAARLLSWGCRALAIPNCGGDAGADGDAAAVCPPLAVLRLSLL